VEAVELVIVTWGLYLVPFLLVGGPVWSFGRRRVQWNRWDFALVLLPFAVWFTLMMANDTGKSLSNLAEALYLGCMAPLSPIIRVVVGDKANQKTHGFGIVRWGMPRGNRFMGICARIAGMRRCTGLRQGQRHGQTGNIVSLCSP